MISLDRILKLTLFHLIEKNWSPISLDRNFAFGSLKPKFKVQNKNRWGAGRLGNSNLSRVCSYTMSSNKMWQAE